jgi:hypothetical protein
MHSRQNWKVDNPNFVQGVLNAEDLAKIPGADWVIASSMPSASRARGCLCMINTRDKSWTPVFEEASTSQFDRDGQTAPVVLRDFFSPHGISIRPGAVGVHELYVVNHGGRESIEVFAVDANGPEPRLSWQNSILMPPHTWPNDVVPIPGGGLLVTNMFDPADPSVPIKMGKGENTGNVLEWHTTEGWTNVPGSEMSGPNGIEVSGDGRWIYVGGWPTKTLVRFSRGSAFRREVVSTGHLTDNLTWASDGSILATGQENTPREFMEEYEREDRCFFPFTVVRVDGGSLETKELLRYQSDQFGTGTVALETESEIWVGSSRADKIACFPFRSE